MLKKIILYFRVPAIVHENNLIMFQYIVVVDVKVIKVYSKRFRISRD